MKTRNVSRSVLSKIVMEESLHISGGTSLMQVARKLSSWMSFGLLFSALAYGQDVNVAGNLNMVDSTATAGNILKGGIPFVHDYGPNKVICKGSLYCLQLGSSNTFVGRYAGNLTMTGDTNTSVGFSSLSSNTTGVGNTASGYQALFSNTTGNYNSAIGTLVLPSNQTRTDNTASGYQALYSNIDGNGNTATGRQALFPTPAGPRTPRSGTTRSLATPPGCPIPR